jgi:hypothetical protein
VEASIAHTNDGEDFDCSIWPGRSVRMRWRNRLSLQFNYADAVEIVRCLGEVLDRSERTLSLGETIFCAYFANDGHYYLLCAEHVILRLSEAQAQQFRDLLSTARERLDIDSAQY